MVTFSRRGLHGHVVDLIANRIIHGELPEGAVLDLEQLSTELTVSRTVVREAVKVLTSKGLLDARPRHGTVVLPRRSWNLLDADVMTWRNSTGPDSQLLIELGEVRLIVEPSGARLAALRRVPGQVAAIRSALQEMIGAIDTASHIAADLRFHRAVVSGTQNELLQRLQAVLEPAMRSRDALAFSHHDDAESIALHQDVSDAIAGGDPARAFDLMTALIKAAISDTASMLDKPAGPG